VGGGGKREVCTLISLSEKAREDSVMGLVEGESWNLWLWEME
jgi:hypothetical protein